MFISFDSRKFLVLVLLMIAGSVVLGAFGSHGLKGAISVRKFEVFQTASLYLSMHSIGLLVLFLLKSTTNYLLTPKIFYSLFSGIIIFCTSLFIVSISELCKMPVLNKFGMTAPVGGILIILGYVFAAIDVFKSYKL